MSRPQPNPIFKAWDTDGTPLAGGKVYTYEVGTTTNKATYSDRNLSTANANPIILDSYGESVIYLAGPTKVNITDSSDVQMPNYPQDWVGDDTQDVYNIERYGTSGTLAAINAAITAISTDVATLYFPAATWSITDDLSIPANITVKREPGAIFDVANTKTLTILGPIESGPTPWFTWTGTGAIDISSSPTADCYLQWWGGVAGVANDCAAAFLKAFQSSGCLSTPFPNCGDMADCLCYDAKQNSHSPRRRLGYYRPKPYGFSSLY